MIKKFWQEPFSNFWVLILKFSVPARKKAVRPKIVSWHTFQFPPILSASHTQDAYVYLILTYAQTRMCYIRAQRWNKMQLLWTIKKKRKTLNAFLRELMSSINFSTRTRKSHFSFFAPSPYLAHVLRYFIWVQTKAALLTVASIRAPLHYLPIVPVLTTVLKRGVSNRFVSVNYKKVTQLV